MSTPVFPFPVEPGFAHKIKYDRVVAGRPGHKKVISFDIPTTIPDGHGGNKQHIGTPVFTFSLLRSEMVPGGEGYQVMEFLRDRADNGCEFFVVENPNEPGSQYAVRFFGDIEAVHQQLRELNYSNLEFEVALGAVIVP